MPFTLLGDGLVRDEYNLWENMIFHGELSYIV